MLDTEIGTKKCSAWTFIVPPGTQFSVPWDAFFHESRFQKNMSLSIFGWSSDDGKHMESQQPAKPFLLQGNMPVPPEFNKMSVDIVRGPASYKVNSVDNCYSDVGVSFNWLGNRHGFSGDANFNPAYDGFGDVMARAIVRQPSTGGRK